MAYTPNAEDTAQPTGNQALSTAALEFRTLKQYIQATKTAQDLRDDAQDVATALVQTNLTTAVVAQGVRDGIQDAATLTAQNTANTGVANAATAQADATTALANAALSVVKVKSIVSITSGSGNVTVPTGATNCLVIGKGGDRQGRNSNDFSVGYSSTSSATKAQVLSVSAGASLAYSIASAVSGDVLAQATTFSSITCQGAPRVQNNVGETTTWTAAAGWLVLVFY